MSFQPLCMDDPDFRLSNEERDCAWIEETEKFFDCDDENDGHLLVLDNVLQHEIAVVAQLFQQYLLHHYHLPYHLSYHHLLQQPLHLHVLTILISGLMIKNTSHVNG